MKILTEFIGAIEGMEGKSRLDLSSGLSRWYGPLRAATYHFGNLLCAEG